MMTASEFRQGKMGLGCFSYNVGVLWSVSREERRNERQVITRPVQCSQCFIFCASILEPAPWPCSLFDLICRSE